MPGIKKNYKKVPYRTCFINGEFSKKVLQMHCEDVYVDQEETNEVQKDRIQRYEKLRNEHFSEGRNVEISVDVVLRARARSCDSKVHGPKEKIVSEMLKWLPLAKLYEVTKIHQEILMGEAEAPVSWRNCAISFPEEGGRRTEEGNPEDLKQFHVGGIDGIHCQHLQVMMTNLLQQHWEWQEHRDGKSQKGSHGHPTLYVASKDIKTAFGGAKPKCITRILEEQNLHEWLIAALLREMAGLEGKANIEIVESTFLSRRWHPAFQDSIAHRKIISRNLKRPVATEEERTRTEGRFLTLRESAWMMYRNVKIGFGNEAKLVFGELIELQLNNVNVRHSDTKMGRNSVSYDWQICRQLIGRSVPEAAWKKHLFLKYSMQVYNQETMMIDNSYKLRETQRNGSKACGTEDQRIPFQCQKHPQTEKA